MSGNNVMIDTNIAIYLLNGDHSLAEILNEKKLFISFITQLELLGYPGIDEEQTKKIENMLTYCVIVDINNSIKSRVIDLRKKYALKLPDCIIAATSIYLDIPLLTADKDFEKIKELNLLLYEK